MSSGVWDAFTHLHTGHELLLLPGGSVLSWRHSQQGHSAFGPSGPPPAGQLIPLSVFAHLRAGLCESQAPDFWPLSLREPVHAQAELMVLETPQHYWNRDIGAESLP